jgi:hypothetical protein
MTSGGWKSSFHNKNGGIAMMVISAIGCLATIWMMMHGYKIMTGPEINGDTAGLGYGGLFHWCIGGFWMCGGLIGLSIASSLVVSGAVMIVTDDEGYLLDPGAPNSSLNEEKNSIECGGCGSTLGYPKDFSGGVRCPNCKEIQTV